MIALTVDLGIPLLMQKTLDDGLSHSDIGLIWLLVLGQLALFTGSTLMNVRSKQLHRKPIQLKTFHAGHRQVSESTCIFAATFFLIHA